MSQAGQLLELRTEKVCGVGPWVWIKADYWAWEQPKQEFPALRDKILAHVAARSTMICAGGCLGMYPRLWADSFELVYTFEPAPLNFHCLTLNCPMPRIVKLNAALGEKAGLCSIVEGPPFNAGLHKCSEDTTTRPHIPVLALDSFAFAAVDAIQLDVEGYEPAILRGARQTIAQHRPVIAVEGDVPESRSLLEEMGYREVDRVGSNPDIIFAPIVPRGANAGASPGGG